MVSAKRSKQLYRRGGPHNRHFIKYYRNIANPKPFKEETAIPQLSLNLQTTKKREHQIHEFLSQSRLYETKQQLYFYSTVLR